VIPLKDDIPSQRPALVTVGLILANILVFLYQISLQMSPDPGAARATHDLLVEFGAVPCRLSGSCPSADPLPHPMLSVVTSMFLHGGLFHIGGNMLYLWIFGDNVEDVLGHGRFTALYLLAGLAAVAAQTVTNPTSGVPMVGASGAISGVLGAYLVLFPYARVLTLLTFGFFVRLVHVPAVVVLGFWIVVQFVAGFLTMQVAGSRQPGGGVAWFAHIGGFLAGLALVFVLRPRRPARL
jgi:membrane associated rhomboid family serine protease